MRRLIWTLIALGPIAHAAEPPTLGTRLEQALRCEGQPSNVVSWLDPLVDKDHPDAAITASGEELDYRIDVQLKQPLEIAGAQTRTVTWQTDGADKRFGGIVYAEFEGDAAAAAKALSLTAHANEDRMGDYRREVPDGNLCPPTVLLTPTERGRFLLGCGWCNG
ncbi:MAG: hypothetical protein MUE46_10750 [Xanthomonadales bacterium]|jgi:hypothetical protein|nr:hypothetical protein [Xanthomonadales bacterium]